MASTEPTPRSSALLVEKVMESDSSSNPTPSLSRTPTVQDIEKAGEQPAPASDTEAATGNDNHAVREIRGLKWLLICVSIFISAFLYGLDTTIAADVQGAVVEQFGHVDQLSWIGSGFPLGSVAVILLVGNLYDKFDMKWIYIGSIALFEIGSAVCGASPNMNALIVGRVIAGAGGSGIYLGALNYFSQLTTAEERGLYISLTGFHWGIGAVLGPLIGGAFSTSSATWRWAFYINLVVGAAAAPVYVLCLPSVRHSDVKSVWQRIEHFDFLGLFLIIATWVLFTVGFSVAGITWAWSDGRSITMMVVLGVVVIATVLQQYFTILTTRAKRAFPGHLLLSRTQLLLYAATSAATTSLFIVVYYIPIYFQFVHSDTAIQAAVRLLPFVVIAVTFNVASGHLLSKIRYYMPVYLISGVFILVGGSVLMVNLKPSTSEGAIYGMTVVIAIGTGLTVQLGYAVASLSVGDDDMGHAISMQNISQIGATVISLVIAGQVFQSAALRNLNAVLAGHGFSDEDIAGAVAGAQSALFAKLSGELRDAAIDAIVKAMQQSFILVVVAGAVMVVAAALMKRERLFGEIVVA